MLFCSYNPGPAYFEKGAARQLGCFHRGGGANCCYGTQLLQHRRSRVRAAGMRHAYIIFNHLQPYNTHLEKKFFVFEL